MIFAKTLSASLEDYLEAIFQIIEEKQAVKPKDIAARMKVGNSSVTGALQALSRKNLINYAPYEVITLTNEGKAAAKDIVRRHEVLSDFFTRVLAIDEAEADKAACQMEHAVTKKILERFVEFIEFVELCPRGGEKWISGFSHHCSRSDDLDTCEKCISHTLSEVKNRNQKGKENNMRNARLKDLEPGQKGKVVKIKARGYVGKRILEMGLTPGAVVEVENIAPMGDPIELKVRGFHLSIRKDEANDVEVEIL
ncbi:MAG: DtxR family transcriptional regulator [Clostridia bacterium]|nr:DtxR family transcriptional regulator [Clostridia bacterium]